MYDLVAIGNALVDTEFKVNDEVLVKTSLGRGSMTLTDVAGQSALFDVLKAYQILPAKQSGGGSAANSVVAFSVLGGKACYHCRVGDDGLGRFYLQDLAQMGVAIDGKAVSAGQTGTCAVLVTPDGERTMQTHLGASSELSSENVDFDTLDGAKYLYLEGYLAMSPALLPVIEKLCQIAKANGTKIVVSFADPAVVNFAKDGLLAWLKLGVDVIFCNKDEATLFAQVDDVETAVRHLLDYASLVVVTNSDKPTTVGIKDGENITLQTFNVPSADVVDTNGAGDNFAGALIYGLLQGWSMDKCVALAGEVASRVVAQFGARLPKDGYLQAKAQI